MASTALKSTSRKGSLTSENSNSNSNTEKVAPRRRTRSLSVSAVSRSRPTQLDIPSDFLYKRDNPLFCSAAADKKETQPLRSAANSSNVTTTTANALTSKPTTTAAQRGRSVTRNSGGGSQKEAGRSLSRIDLGRRGRSVSRGHNVNGASESEVEQESKVSSNHRKTCKSILASSNVKKSNTLANAVNSAGNARSLRQQSHRSPSVEPSDHSTSSWSNSPILNWEDGVSTGSLSEADEKTIKAVCAQMKSFRGDHVEGDTGTTGIYETVRSEVRRAISDFQNDLETAIRRNSTSAVATADINDIPPDFGNPGAVELVLDIRREYAKKLEESQERARKLRADLVVEEHHGQELSRILKEILPNPKTSTIQRSRLARRTSSERKKMSKRLTEEAMSYFDECVSISTFDSSDFSAPEDRPHSSAGVTSPIGRTVTSFPQESPCISASYEANSRLINKQESLGHIQLMHSGEDSILTANSSCNEATVACRKSYFSFSHSPNEDMKTIRSYIKNFEKEGFVNSNVVRSNNYGDNEHYNLQAESLLFEKVLWKSRTESGSLHICGGAGFSFPFSPFASVI